LIAWAEHKGLEGLAAYREQKNQRSIDGLAYLREVAEIAVLGFVGSFWSANWHGLDDRYGLVLELGRGDGVLSVRWSRPGMRLVSSSCDGLLLWLRAIPPHKGRTTR
jgi:hypothetical protein